jgi:hypothetical protein
MDMDKLGEIADELRKVLAGRSSLVDAIIPPLLFLLTNALFGFQVAMWSALASAAGIMVLRLRRRQSLLYALGGVTGVALAILVAQALGRSEGFFLPRIVTGGLTILLCLISVLVGRPIVAWTSYLTRRWPLAWYWQARVRPAYSEVTWLWILFFSLRLGLQVLLFEAENARLLAVVDVLTGWPATIMLLIISYLYGTWRLRQLGGPSVEEFASGAPPPWQGQQRGF